MKDGKPTGGYDRLKIKYAELERRYNEEVYEHQALEKAYIAALQRADAYWLHMGRLRQWLWRLKHRFDER